MAKPYSYDLRQKVIQASQQDGLKKSKVSSLFNLSMSMSLGLIAPFTVKGACNRKVFETWLLTCLLPVLRPGQVVVMDNATFHKGGRIEQLICSCWL